MKVCRQAQGAGRLDRLLLLPLACLVILRGGPAAGAADNAPDALHNKWDALLQRHVANGLVDYKAFKRNMAQLDEYLEILGKTHCSELPRNAQLAFWINAYNAFTVKLILNHYPVESIRGIESPWKQQIWLAGGKMHSLDEINHTILRAQFKEPRIHFAVVCASIGGPDLRNRAFTAGGLEQELQDATQRFLNSRRHLRVEEKRPFFGRARKTLHLSPIFDWFRADFTEENARTVADFVAPYVDKPTRDFLLSGGPDMTIRYLDYDWSLNGR